MNEADHFYKYSCSHLNFNHFNLNAKTVATSRFCDGFYYGHLTVQPF